MRAREGAETRSVLVVDDDHDIRDALAGFLEDRGFQVIAAQNGLEALEVLRAAESPPSAILLDLMMPVMDGYTFLAEQARDPALAAIPVAIVTAAHAIDRSRLVTNPPVVAKPIKVPQLLDTLAHLRSSPDAP